MKTKKEFPLISLLFVAIMLFSIGMIVKEHRERQQDIKPYRKKRERPNLGKIRLNDLRSSGVF